MISEASTFILNIHYVQDIYLSTKRINTMDFTYKDKRKFIELNEFEGTGAFF
jgi:hypothetical protein